MHLTPEFRSVYRSATHFLFLEARGSFAEVAPRLWQELPPLLTGLGPQTILEYLGLSGMEHGISGDEGKIYQAGVSLVEKPPQLPEGMRYRLVPAGCYALFLLTGPYTQIGQAFERAFQLLSEKKTALRVEFCMENYVNDPQTTPEAQLMTELLIPTA